MVREPNSKSFQAQEPETGSGDMEKPGGPPPLEDNPRGAGEAASARPKAPTKRELESAVQKLEAETQELKSQLAQRASELEQVRDKYLRALAENQNIRRRAAEEQARALAYQKQTLLRALLPVLDNFRYALANEAAAGDSGFAEGVRLILRQLEDILKAQGVVPLEVLGKPFDPSLHQAAEQVQSEEVPPGTIVEVVREGYRLGDQVLRPALVKVATPTAPVGEAVAGPPPEVAGEGPPSPAAECGAETPRVRRLQEPLDEASAPQ